jgi:hypothetical protein
VEIPGYASVPLVDLLYLINAASLQLIATIYDFVADSFMNQMNFYKILMNSVHIYSYIT